MGECARCGDFTDAPADGDYQYCRDCQETFDEIEASGVVVEQTSDGYHIYAVDDGGQQGGVEDSQTDALARGKYISDNLGVRALFKYERTGSRWVLEEYLREHPKIRRDVMARLSRVPEEDSGGLLGRIRRAIER